MTLHSYPVYADEQFAGYVIGSSLPELFADLKARKMQKYNKLWFDYQGTKITIERYDSTTST